MEDFGSLDRKIIAALQMDGRASWTDIANLVGASVPMVARRGRQLMESGALRIAVVPNLSGRGPVERFFVKLRCSSGTQDAVGRTLSSRKDARFSRWGNEVGSGQKSPPGSTAGLDGRERDR